MLENLAKRLLIGFSSRFQIFLLSDGRSGSTWIARVLNFDGRYLEFFEPYHGRRFVFLRDGRIYPTVQDLAKLESPAYPLTRYANPVRHFAGLQRPTGIPWAGVLVKDITSQLILSQVLSERQRKLLLLRHPVSVAMSKERYGRWHSRADIETLLRASPELGRIGLKCFDSQLVGSRFLEYILVWCLLYRGVFSHLAAWDFSVVFYEELLRTPQRAFPRLFESCGCEKAFEKHEARILALATEASATTVAQHRITQHLTEERPWERERTDAELAKAFEILRRFELFGIYEDSIMPKLSEGGISRLARRLAF